MANDFDEEKKKALALIVGAQGQLLGAATFATQALIRPYNDWLKLWATMLTEPAPPVREWPARAVVSGISYLTDQVANQHAAYEAVMAACKAGVGAPQDVIQIDPKSEAAGPIMLSPLVPVIGLADLVVPPLVSPGNGAIPARCVAVGAVGALLAFSLVDLTHGNLGPQPLKLGMYTGDLHLRSGALVAHLRVQVIESVAP